MSRPLAVRVALLGMMLLVGCKQAEELPVLASVPDFTFTDQQGRTVRGRDFDGHVWIADFMFTRCTSACPMLTAQMLNFQRRLGDRADDVRMVSFTVDPAHDTPEVLHGFARDRGTTRNWTYLTGDDQRMRETAKRGFLMAVGDPTTNAEGQFDILHSQHLVLIDRQRRIRGFYRTDLEGMDALEEAVGTLLAQR